MASTSPVTNLNADLLDGKHASDFSGKTASVSEYALAANNTNYEVIRVNGLAAGNYDVKTYLRITATTTVSIWVTYTDAGGTAQSTYIVSNQSFSAGSYSLLPLFINVINASNAVLAVNASVANAVKVSASIVGV